MSEPAAIGHPAAGFVVLREVTAGHWVVVGETDRRPGLPASKARPHAVADRGRRQGGRDVRRRAAQRLGVAQQF